MTGWLLVALATASVGEPRRGGERPLPSDSPSALSDDARFRVHWSTDPALAPEGAEDDAVPPGVDVVFDAIEQAEVAFRQRGYVAVSPDDGTGGDDALDIYFLPIDANGYAYPLRDAAPDGGAACYIELDSGLRGNLLASVIQHELHHCVQFRYATRAAPWIYEASATWEQYRLADASLDLGLQFLYGARLAEPDRPLDDRGDRYEYAGFLVFKHLDDYRRPAHRSAHVWEALALDRDWQTALGRVTDTSFDLSLEEWFAVYSTYNAFACGLSDERHYDEDTAGCTIEASVPIVDIAIGETVAVSASAAPLTSTTYELAVDDSADIEWSCDTPASGAWVATLTPVDARGTGGLTTRTSVIPSAGRVQTQGDVDADGSVRIVMASVGEDPLDVSCTAQIAPALEQPGSCRHAVYGTGPGWAWLGVLTGLGIRGRRRRR